MNKFKTFDGLNLAYTDDGPKDALPLLCLAGLTRNSQDFCHLSPHLGDVRLICMDYRGRGQSDWSPSQQDYTIPVEARDVLALLDHLELPSVAVLGTSRGGLIGMTLALMAKDRLRGLCLNDIGPELNPRGLNRIMDYLGQPPPYASVHEMALDRPRVMSGFVDVPHKRWVQEVENQTITTDAGLTINYDPALRDAVIEASAAGPQNLWPLFDALHNLPIGLLRGANSDLLTPNTAQAMRMRHTDCLFAQVANRGHVPFLDEPESIQLIRQWIDKCQ